MSFVDSDCTDMSFVDSDCTDMSFVDSDCTDMPWCDDCDDVEKSSVPLSSSRGYFLNTWSSMEMEGDVWKKGN